MSDIGNLIIKFGADATELERAFTKLGGSAAQFQRGLESLGKVAATAFFAAATAAVAMTIAAGEQAERLEQLSHVTGINTDELQKYDVMLHRAGLSGDDLALAMKKMSVNMDQARLGTGTAGDRFRQLGIDIRSVTSTDDLIRKVTNSASKFADGLGKDAIMAELLGRSWQTFIKAFSGGAKAFDEAEAASKRLGATMSGRNLSSMVEMNHAIRDMGTAWDRFGQQLGVLVEPAVTMVVHGLTALLSIGSQVFRSLDTAADTLAIRFTHVALAINEIAATLFSSHVLSGDAWKQTAENLRMIDKEAASLIAKRREIDNIGVPKDTRPQVPLFVDTSKESERAIALLDAQLKAKEAAAQQIIEINRAILNNHMAALDADKAYAIKTDEEIAVARAGEIKQQDDLEIDQVNKMIVVYTDYVARKKALFTSDAKGQAELLKFQSDASAKLAALDAKRLTAQIDADTARIQSGLQVKNFFIQQLQDIASANVFATAQIINTWTSGVANSIVNGGKFAKAAWKSTELALVQGILNVAVQWAAKKALAVAQQVASDAAIITSNTSRNAEMAGSDTIAAALHTSVWAGASAAVSGFFAATMATFEAMVGTMVATITAVGEFVMGVLAAIAEALSDTIFGIPYAGAILVGIAAIAAALAATGNLGFREGGIGNFGEGTPAMLHGTEAVIPLDSRGASFMQEAFGGGGDGRPIHTHVYLNGREIARAVSDQLPGALRAMGSL